MRIKKSYHSLLSGFGTERDDPIDRKKRSKDKMRPVLAFLNHLQGSSQICHVRYLEDLRGLGASDRDGARWNEPGFPIVHFAETPSVAMLEMAHYLPSPRLVPPGYRLGVYEASDEVALERWHVHDLPEGWDRYPHPRSTRRMGTLWLMRKEAPLLAVPSVAVSDRRRRRPWRAVHRGGAAAFSRARSWACRDSRPKQHRTMRRREECSAASAATVRTAISAARGAGKP